MDTTTEEASTTQSALMEKMHELQREVVLLREATANNRPAEANNDDENFFSFRGACVMLP